MEEADANNWFRFFKVTPTENYNTKISVLGSTPMTRTDTSILLLQSVVLFRDDTS